MKSLTALFYFLLFFYLAEFFLTWSDSKTSMDSYIGDAGGSLIGVDIANSEPYSASIIEESTTPESFSRTYSWDYEGQNWQLTLPLDDELYEKYKSRTRNRDYDLFASDPYDDWLIKDIAEALLSLSKAHGLEERQIPELCISFVQSLNYTSDLESSGYDQYPRFPYETLYENGGDCEDTSILSVAILQEMGYDAVLLELPEHMALGINCDTGNEGRSFEYEGSSYYYLETTGSDWQIGEVPEEYADQPVHVVPVCRRPMISLDFKAQCEYSKKEGVVDINVTVRNVGSERAENTTVYVALQAKDKLSLWDETESSSITVEPEEFFNYTAKGLTVPAGEKFRVYVQASGENMVSENITSDWTMI